ncbi:putative cyclic nucleotide-gated ion channel 20, chloroplastic [Dorcoceras hygrometricum]|uniref:Putative cyclic nucleotide-gated ion channel 20, chloroplastic n=1 Tax=Dorcoceras hygrometricum TaxID=472368 RepID=A0A2Z7AWV3_9LAMI|nr:putative cyclic nucleotide-gated ion channel 20, chloroplastic [Dorcoceras hygrometricum]
MHVTVKKNRSSRPANKLAIVSIEPLYPHSVSTGEIIGLRSSSPSAITARWSSDTNNQSVTTPMIALDLSGTTHLSAGHNVALSQARQLQFAQLASSLVSTTTAGTTSKVQKNQRTLWPKHHELSATSLAPNNDRNQRKSTGEVFECTVIIEGFTGGDDKECRVQNTLSVEQHLVYNPRVKATVLKIHISAKAKAKVPSKLNPAFSLSWLC